MLHQVIEKKANTSYNENTTNAVVCLGERWDMALFWRWNCVNN